MHTRGRVTADTPNPDGQIFLNAVNFLITGTAATLTSAGAGLITLNQPASQTTNYWADLGQLLRSGVLATPNLTQEQFGTAALQPGPSSVSNTGGPLGVVGIPPYTNANNPIYGASASSVTGPIAKGLQINWVDVILEVDTTALTSATFSLSKTTFPAAAASAAPVVTNQPFTGTVALTTNTAGQCTRSRLTITTPIMYSGDAISLVPELVIVTPATSTCKFYGMIFGVSYNYN